MKNAIRTVIIDDEHHSVNILVNIIGNHIPELEIIGTAYSVIEGVEVIDKHKPELVLLDVELSDGIGFDVLEKVSFHEFEVIFVTAYNKYAKRAFDFAAIHYLLKPISVMDLQEATERLIKSTERTYKKSKLDLIVKNYNTPYERIALPDESGTRLVEISEIIRVESNGSYSIFHFINSKDQLMISKNLKRIENLLSEYGFVRIHNQHLINIKHIKKYKRRNTGVIIMKDDVKLTVSYTKKNALNSALENQTLFL